MGNSVLNDSSTVIKHIARTLQLYGQQSSSMLPYFFIVGAGISVPLIPSANGIIKECKDQLKSILSASEYQQAEEKLASCNPVEQYSNWMELAFPNKIDRSAFFREKIKKAGITSANLLLAQILCSRKLAATVFTPNFDDKLKQSLELLGERDVFIAENAMDNLYVSPFNKDELQIVHLHGTYRFYDCANLKDEISAVTDQSGTLSSKQVLRNFLQQQVPIIVGYSGWEGDVIMACLKERLSYPVPRKYIWVCYSQEAFDSLPDWLKENQNIIFVLPDAFFDAKTVLEDDSDNSAPHFQSEITGTSKSIHVDAASFFYKLISNLGIPEPCIFAKPSDYYKTLSEDILPKDQYAWHLKYWAEKMYRATVDNDPVEAKIMALENALSAVDFEDTLCRIKELSDIDYSDAESEANFVCSFLFPKVLSCDFLLNTDEQRYALCSAMLEFQKKNCTLIRNRAILQQKIINVAIDIPNFSELTEMIYSISRICPDSTFEELLSWGILIDELEDQDQLPELDALIAECRKINAPDDDTKMFLHYVQFKRLLYIPIKDAVVEYTGLIRTIGSPKTPTFMLHPIFIGSFLASTYSDITHEFIEEVLHQLEQTCSEILLNQNTLQRSQSVAKCYFPILYLLKCDTDVLENVQDFPDRIEQIINSLDKECTSSKFQSLRDKLSVLMCELSPTIVSDQRKLQILQELKRNSQLDSANEDKPVFNTALLYAFEQTCDPEAYRSAFSLFELGECDIMQGVHEYEQGNYSAAEQSFARQLRNPNTEVATIAAGDLAYMLRRGELISGSYSFDELAQISFSNHTTKINIILHSFLNKNCEITDLVTNAWSTLCEISEEERNQAEEWWEKAELVGQFEHDIVKLILQSAQQGESLSCLFDRIKALSVPSTPIQ